MKGKSKLMKKWAKKHGLPFKELKLKKVKAKDFVGLPFTGNSRDFSIQFIFVETDERYTANSEYDAGSTIVTVNQHKFDKLGRVEQGIVLAHEAMHAIARFTTEDFNKKTDKKINLVLLDQGITP